MRTILENNETWKWTRWKFEGTERVNDTHSWKRNKQKNETKQNEEIEKNKKEWKMIKLSTSVMIMILKSTSHFEKLDNIENLT